MKGKFGTPSRRLGMMQFNLNSIRVSKSSKLIEPEPTTNQTKYVNLPSLYSTDFDTATCIVLSSCTTVRKYLLMQMSFLTHRLRTIDRLLQLE